MDNVVSLLRVGIAMAKFGCLQAPSKMYLHLETSFFSPKLREQGKYYTFKTYWMIHFPFSHRDSIQMLSHLLFMLIVDIEHRTIINEQGRTIYILGMNSTILTLESYIIYAK